jgi:hypothetical protein
MAMRAATIARKMELRVLVCTSGKVTQRFLIFSKGANAAWSDGWECQDRSKNSGNLDPSEQVQTQASLRQAGKLLPKRLDSPSPSGRSRVPARVWQVMIKNLCNENLMSVTNGKKAAMQTSMLRLRP